MIQRQLGTVAIAPFAVPAALTAAPALAGGPPFAADHDWDEALNRSSFSARLGRVVRTALLTVCDDYRKLSGGAIQSTRVRSSRTARTEASSTAVSKLHDPGQDGRFDSEVEVASLQPPFRAASSSG